ncbi:MAG TPA: rhomboid family intramembrane serine protease, partial [Chthoniobacteraceae bacterium]
MPDDSDALRDASLVEIGRYLRLSDARERGLVIAAMDLPHWVVRVGDEFTLRVEPGAHEAAARELERYEVERTERHIEAEPVAGEKVRTLSLYVGAWIMAALWLWQNLQSGERIARGAAESRAILNGEWWRTFTALTLHGDFSHFAANLATGLLFAGFALPRFGTGITWLGIVLSGAFGNLANAA